MATPILFPDTEMWAVNLLQARLATYGYPGMFVSNRRGNQPTAVWIRRDGGPVLDQVREAARLGVNCYAPDELAVNTLARTVAAIVCSAADGAPVVRVQQTSGPSPIAVEQGQPLRRYMTFEVWQRGATLTPV